MPPDSLLDHVAQLPPAEVAGSQATNRFRYQHHWAIALMLDQLAQDVDFLVVCEHHEDVMLMWPADAPTACALFQVKTYDGKTANWSWTVARLCSRKKGKEDALLPSPLGKLVANMRRVGTAKVERAVFTSNRPFKVIKAPETTRQQHDALVVHEIGGECKTSLTDKIKSELDYPLDTAEEDVLHLSRASLPLDDYEMFVRAKLSKLLEQLHGAEANNAGPLLRTMQAEVARCSSYEEAISSADELLAHKSINRERFEGWCRTSGKSRPAFITWWGQASEELARAGFSFKERQSMRAQARKVAVQRAAADHAITLESDEAVVRGLLQSGGFDTFADLVGAVHGDAIASQLDQPDLATAILINLVFDDDQELQATDSGTAEEPS